jgi:hypothetical protein
MWCVFLAWLATAVLCGVADHLWQSTLFLPIFSISSALITVVATKKLRPRNYRFDLMRPGVVRSPLGFEVRASDFRLEYVEGDHVISWQAGSLNNSACRYTISEQGIPGWDAPFSSERMENIKKREVAQAVKSALLYLQLVDAGKIRPKNTR